MSAIFENEDLQLSNTDIENFIRVVCKSVKLQCMSMGECYNNADDVITMRRCPNAKYCCFVINTSPRASPQGEHWICYVLSHKHEKLFFDSYGRSPKEFAHDIRYLKYTWKNIVPLQHDKSTVCGCWVCYFIFCLNFDYNYLEYLPLTSNTLQNDALVVKWFVDCINYWNVFIEDKKKKYLYIDVANSLNI